ncbi:YheC/YheD family protein [Bacillus infantis]|uniref:YheC/YheD family endospore coat-associated protein n=1 Tax=Bacillus infantis TaxID=324767 RepID=UPI0020A0961A|nr:YheC/YheD family protein [Bacillus infantis]MCP1157488.1 YheC/YheD family protein [Bacillus infantis]
MSLSFLTITFVPGKMFQDKDAIKVSHSLYHYWSLDADRDLTLKIGKKERLVAIEPASIPKDEIHMDSGLFSYFQLAEEDIRLIVQYAGGDRRLAAGPIIGLMTEPSEDHEEVSFRSVHSFCGELQAGIEEFGGIFYVFHIKDFRESGLSGYCWRDGRWVKEQVPFPTVIYNRIHSRKLESGKYFGNFKYKLQELGIPMFNDCFLSKDLVYDILAGEEHMKPYLPETRLLGARTLENMLSRYHEVFIKPVNGSQGRNIVRLSLAENKLSASFSSAGAKDAGKSFPDCAAFFKWFEPQLRTRVYLVQEPIQLASLNGRQLDFRVLCHKGPQNSWRATSAVARISAEQQFVSNIARGGETMKPVKALTLIADKATAVQQAALMKELAVEAAGIISNASEGIVGELGMDLGIDRQGKLWIIEANSKPSKNFEEADQRIRPSAKALIEYFIWLSFQAAKS